MAQLTHACLLLAVALVAAAPPALAGAVPMLETFRESPTGYTKLRSSGNSTLYNIELAGGTNAGERYATPPMLLDLHGTRDEIGFDFAALLHAEAVAVYNAFTFSVFNKPSDVALVGKFADFCWDSFLSKYTPPEYLAELEGMKRWYTETEEGRAAAAAANLTADVVSYRFYTLANMPADTVNIVAMLEQELEQGWPLWLKEVINEIIKLLLHLGHSCDFYGVWGSRTQGELLWSSRNLDYASNTGINRYKLISMYSIEDPKFGGKLPGGTYATIGYAFGLGALAGISQAGITTSEMNLDNSVVTFSGVPFPLRLRYVLERSTDLTSAMAVWSETNNTNSFNFGIGSAADALRLRDARAARAAGLPSPSAGPDDAAYALETIMGYTAQFGANSTVERDATYDCKADKCRGWTNQQGEVHIGHPLPEAVWRTNHGFAPRIMATQEPLFNNTVFRYDLMYTLFSELEEAKQLVDDEVAVGIVATLGTKGANYYSCDQDFNGDNVMSIAYAPGPRGSDPAGVGHFFVAWESGSGDEWRPAACSPYIRIDLSTWLQDHE